MEPNVQLILTLFEVIKQASESIALIKAHDPAAYATVEARHRAAGLALDQARIPGL